MLENDVFVGPNAALANNHFRRSTGPSVEYARTPVRSKASIGANATILAGTVVGADYMIGARVVVTRDVPPNAIVTGKPARITGYVSAHGRGPLRADHHGAPTLLPFQLGRYFAAYYLPAKAESAAAARSSVAGGFSRPPPGEVTGGIRR